MDPVQNLSIKIKKYSWTWSMTGGPWNRSKVGVHGPLVHLLSFGSKAITESSFQPSSGKFLWRIRHPAGSWMVAAKIFPQFSQVAWASARRLIAHLIAYIKSINAMGECCYGFDLSMLMLILQHSVWSWSLWCFYMLFNCYFKECFNAKGRTKNRDIDFLRLFSLGFQRSFKTEVLCCTQSIIW